MQGRLYGIGVGPGDPELLTIKAINTIKDCDVIAVPKAGQAERTACSIVAHYLEGKSLLECSFSMDRDEDTRIASRKAAAAKVIAYLDKGSKVGFITLGDPTTYSTYMYLQDIIVSQGYEATIVPGITSYAAAAAAFGMALCEGDETLTIIPGKHSEDLAELLDHPGNKVLMKSGSNLQKTLEILKQRGLAHNTRIATRVTMSDERLYTSIEDYERSPEAGYFTIALVKEDR